MTETEKKMYTEHVEFVRQIRIKTSKLILSTGLNVAHDYDGVESEADCLLYLDAVLREVEKNKLVLTTINQLIQLTTKD